MLPLLLALQFASAEVHAWCADNGVMHVDLGRASLELGDHRPHLSTLRAGTSTKALQSGRLYLNAHPVDQVEYRGTDGDVRRLVVNGSGWKIFDESGAEIRNLRVPTGFRRGVPPLLLADRGRFAWFVSSTHVLRVDLAADRRV
ncbi:MAG: hypothetical protein AAF658_04745, partial [Myxococcota bacterium]